MAGRVAARLQELGINLPDAPKPVANYVPFVITGNLVLFLVRYLQLVQKSLSVKLDPT